MTARNFDINRDGCSVRCRSYLNDPKAVRRVVIYGHGFGGHKETKAAERFAELAATVPELEIMHVGIFGNEHPGQPDFRWLWALLRKR